VSAVPTRSRYLSSYNSPGQRRSQVHSPAPEARGQSTSRERATQHTREAPPQDDAGESLCDYDTSATVLYELLESSCWEKARSRCRSHPAEVRTWIVRKDKSLRVRWKLLPLHAAIIFQSPNFVVSALLEKYPGAASRKDDQGMLPLHLAFRHKHEDEDLLELLLVQYPKAVMIKDRRDRVPLEHGRECKYSAKLMRMYADATVAGSRALSMGKGDDTYMNSLSSSQRTRLEAENDARMASLRAQYETEIKTLKVVDEDRLKTLREHHAVTIKQMQNAADDVQQDMLEKHNEEMDELRRLLSGLADKDKKEIEEMEQEIIRLRANVDDVGLETARASSQYQRMFEYTKELREVMESICENHAMMEEMVAQQQDELDSASSMRKQLVQTLLRQEDNEGENDRLRGTKLRELAKSTREAIEKALEADAFKQTTRADRQQIINSGHREHSPRREYREVVSRVEVERDSDGGRFNAEVVLEMDPSGREDDRFTAEAREEFYSGVDEKQTRRLDFLKNQKESTDDECFGEAAILGDEISAITELSG